MIDELSHLYCRVIHQIGAVKTQPVRKFNIKRNLQTFIDILFTIPKNIETINIITTCKTKAFIWDSPCNKRELASLNISYTDLTNLLNYNKKRRFSASSSWLAGAVRFELTTLGFGDRCSTSWAIPLSFVRFIYLHKY